MRYLTLPLWVVVAGCAGPTFTNLGNGVGVPAESIEKCATEHGVTRAEARSQLRKQSDDTAIMRVAVKRNPRVETTGTGSEVRTRSGWWCAVSRWAKARPRGHETVGWRRLLFACRVGPIELRSRSICRSSSSWFYGRSHQEFSTNQQQHATPNDQGAHRCQIS